MTIAVTSALYRGSKRLTRGKHHCYVIAMVMIWLNLEFVNISPSSGNGSFPEYNTFLIAASLEKIIIIIMRPIFSEFK